MNVKCPKCGSEGLPIVTRKDVNDVRISCAAECGRMTAYWDDSGEVSEERSLAHWYWQIGISTEREACAVLMEELGDLESASSLAARIRERSNA